MSTDKPSFIEEQPVLLATGLTTAVTSTLGILLVVGVDPDLVAALIGTATGWIAFGFAWAKAKVTPTSKVALTVSDVALIDAATAAK